MACRRRFHNAIGGAIFRGSFIGMIAGPRILTTIMTQPASLLERSNPQRRLTYWSVRLGRLGLFGGLWHRRFIVVVSFIADSLELAVRIWPGESWTDSYQDACRWLLLLSTARFGTSVMAHVTISDPDICMALWANRRWTHRQFSPPQVRVEEYAGGSVLGREASVCIGGAFTMQRTMRVRSRTLRLFLTPAEADEFGYYQDSDLRPTDGAA